MPSPKIGSLPGFSERSIRPEPSSAATRITNKVDSAQRRNRLGRMLYQFLTTQQQYLQYEVRAIRQAVADPSLKNAGQVANTILLNHLIPSTINDSARVMEAVFDEDKTTDDLIEELAHLAAGMNPVVRDIGLQQHRVFAPIGGGFDII